LLITIFTGLSLAADGSLEKDMQRALLQSKIVIKTMQARLNEQFSISFDLGRLQSIAEEIRATHLLLDARFAKREEQVRTLGPRATERHAEVLRKYRLTIEEYLNLIDPLKTEQDVTPNVLDSLLQILNSILPDKRRPIYGALPYRHLNYPQKLPLDSPAIIAAYQGGDQTVTPEDTASAPEAPTTKEIADLAESLNWNPVSIYEWVKNNIETQWYWGCMKGAAETLRQKSGNDADQAALLVSLLRAGGYPARYVRGVIEFFPDIERAKHLVGIADENQLAAFFRKAGIPVKTVIDGGRISNLQIEHIWVETRVPYANYRGAVIDEHGKTWLALDTSIKVAGYTYGETETLPEDFDLAAIRDDYLSDVRQDTPLEYLRDTLDAHLEDTQAGFTYEELLLDKTLQPEQMKILPAGLQFRQVAVTAEYNQLPEALLHRAVFTAADTAQNELFTITLPVYELSNRKIILTYQPETVEDQEIINSYGGLANTPSYLVRLRPVLEVDDDRKAVGQDGLSMGSEFNLAIELTSPKGAQRIENVHVIGNVSAVGLVSQNAVAPEEIPADNKGAEQLLYETALNYIDRWNLAEEELASLLQLSLCRPIPSLITIGGVIDVTYLFDSPHDLEWKGLYVDADLRTVEAARGPGAGEELNSEVIFMQLSALQGSVLESRVLEDNFEVDSISTAKLLGIAANQGTSILTINADNIDTLLPTLPFADNIKEDIINSVNQNSAIRIPQSEILFEDWLGVGYVKENLQTGEAGYMLSGEIAGGMTAWGIDRWRDYFFARLIDPFSEPPNQDVQSATLIQKITRTDLQKGMVGELLTEPLKVMVMDDEFRPVVGVEVTFTVKAGGGKFADGTTTYSTKTNFSGVAEADFILGEKTSDNSTNWWESGYTYSQQVGENIIDAELPTGTTIAVPFTAYAFPGEPVEMRKLAGDEDWVEILSWAGFISVAVEDQFGNPVSNVAVTFQTLPGSERRTCSNPNQDSRPALLVDPEDPCLDDSVPTYEGCATGTTSYERKTSRHGALAQTLLGGLPGADYPFIVTAGGLSQTFILHTYKFGNCSGDASPDIEFVLTGVGIADRNSRIITAAKTGASIPVKARMSILRENESSRATEIDCDGTPKSCFQLVGTRNYYEETDFLESTITFGGQPGSDQGNGVYLGEYQLQAGINSIRVYGEATVSRRRVNESCSGCTISEGGFSDNGYLFLTAYGVDIPTDPEVYVAVDEFGYATCDVDIKYRIEPVEYQAYSAYVVLYKDDQQVSFIPSETSGEGFGTIARGFKFDLESVYEAEVVLNEGSGVEIRSDRIALSPADVRIEEIYLDDYKDSVLQGESAFARVTTFAADRPVLWEIVYWSDGVEAQIGSSTGKIFVPEESDNGYIIVRATDSEIDCVYKEVKVNIGCQACQAPSGNCKVMGNGSLYVESIDARFSLGSAQRGQSAGEIYIKSDNPSAILSTPRALVFTTVARGIEPLYDDKDQLRQVLSPEALVDIVVTSPFSYDINFYHADDAGEKIEGLYQVDPGAEPVVTWRIENPDASETVYNRLQISELRNGDIKVNEYVLDEDLNTWSFARGNGLRVESRREILNPEQNTRTSIRTVTDSSDNIASIEETTYQQLPWGEEIVRTVVDPEGAVLTTETGFHEDPEVEGSYGKINTQINSDGSWVRYAYDELGRKILEVRPWLDTPVDAPIEFARAVYYNYEVVDPDDSEAPIDSNNPRTVTEKIQGITVSKTFYFYRADPSGERTEIVEQASDPAAVFGDAGNLRTVTMYYPSGTGLADTGAIKSQLSPDGRLQSHTYEFGTYTPDVDPAKPGVFTPGTGSAIRTIVVSGTSASPEGIAYKTTRQISIQDELGRQPLQTVEVFDGSAYHQIQWSVQVYDRLGRMTNNYQSNGTYTESTWGCCIKDSETDARGIERTFTYDDLQRIVTATKLGMAAGTWPAQSDIQTNYTYDAAGRQLTQTISSDGLSLSSSNVYDGAGRLRSTTDPSQLITTYDYDPSGLVTTLARPGGATEVTARYQDGRTKSITGTDVVASYYEYGVNADGTQWTKVLIGGPASLRWEKTTIDILGRTIRTEKPGFIGIESTENYYNTKGQLVKTTTSGLADTIYEYDELGNQVRNGLDVDHSGALEIASNDRITESDSLFALISGNWWQENSQRVYAMENVATVTTTGTSRSRLTGWSDGKTSETLNIDIHGNQTASWTVTDRDNKTMIRAVDFPDSNFDVISTTVNELLMSSRSKTNVTSTFEYDALGRRTGVVDPRTGTSVTHFNDKNQIDYVEDAAGNRTQFAYFPDTGLKFSESNALNKNTYFIYNDRGQVTHTWGDVPYPVKYEYDEYAQLSRMHTYRSGSSWNSAMWPEGDTGSADITTWHYHEATGLLEAKEDARGQMVSYTYTANGQLATRTWARTEGGNPLATAYGYDPDTAELKSIDYSDSTPDMGFTYDRLGRQKTVTDAVGTRTFAYDNALQLESETITGLYDQVITRTYATSGLVGRSTGFNVGPNYSMAYGYEETTGRFNSIVWNVGGTSVTATYSYAENSDLLQQLDTDNGLQTTHSYESRRNLRTRVKNEFSNNLISQYDYEYDALGRRKSVTNSGQAFAEAAFNRFGYDDRNQLTDSSRYLGSDVNDLSNPVQPEHRNYQYDPIGNRQNATGWDDAVSASKVDTYASNSLNQYDQITTDNGQPTTDNLTYDFDGNLTAIESSGSTKLYKYNAENRLIAVEPQIPVDGDVKVEYTYDYIGRRVQKKLYTRLSDLWLLTSDILFVYDGWNVVKETTTDNGQPPTDKYYVWGLDLSQSHQGAGGIGGLIATVNGSLTHYFCYDGNGNVGQLVTSSDGSIAAHYEYDPYGNELVANGPIAENNAYRFSTKYFDSENGIYYYGYRYYFPQFGRWLNRDPINEAAGPNINAYVNNQPTNLWDLLGLLDADCDQCDCDGLKDITEKLNGHVQNIIQMGGTLDDIRDRLSTDEWYTSYSYGLTSIDLWINNLGEDYCKLKPFKFRARVPFTGAGYRWASCIKITCGSTNNAKCIGADKISHFFQQGYMLYEIASAFKHGKEYAVEFSKWTEGLYKNPENPTKIEQDVDNWLQGGGFKFHDMEGSGALEKDPKTGAMRNNRNRISGWKNKWGNIGPFGILSPPSVPDHKANLSGLRFWQALAAGSSETSKFNICDWVNLNELVE
jgi:RHS repeat-associated protein